MRSFFPFLACCFAVLAGFPGHAQPGPFSLVNVGFSYTYLSESVITEPWQTLFTTEVEQTFRFKAELPLGGRWWAGADARYIRARNQYTGPGSYWLSGLLVQYDLLQTGSERIFAEASLNRGNYCLCGDFPPEREAANYAGAGLTGSFYLWKQLQMDAGFGAYFLLGKYSAKQPYLQYVFGLKYGIPVRKSPGH